MARKPENPIFLERERYRMRRLMDAARLAGVYNVSIAAQESE